MTSKQDSKFKLWDLLRPGVRNDEDAIQLLSRNARRVSLGGGAGEAVVIVACEGTMRELTLNIENFQSEANCGTD